MKKLILIICMIFLTGVIVDNATAQSGKKATQGKPQVYRCGNKWSYSPCPPEGHPAAAKQQMPELPDITTVELNEGEAEVEKLKLLDRLDRKIKSIEHTHHVVPNHAYKIEALCKNPEISVATCSRLISELEESMRSYDRGQFLAEMERREEREPDEKKRAQMKAERLRMLRHMPKDAPKDTKQDIDKF